MKTIETSEFKLKIDCFLEKAKEYCNIKFGYIFGSYSRGEETEKSDIDFAFMIEEGLSKVEEVFARGNLIELGKEIFKYEVIKDGTIIKDNEERAEFESLSIREYFDFKYYSDYYDECMLNYLRKSKGEKVNG